MSAAEDTAFFLVADEECKLLEEQINFPTHMGSKQQSQALNQVCLTLGLLNQPVPSLELNGKLFEA